MLLCCSFLSHCASDPGGLGLATRQMQPPQHRHTAPWCHCWGSAPGRSAIQASKPWAGPHLQQALGPTPQTKLQPYYTSLRKTSQGPLGAGPRERALILEQQSSLLPGRAWGALGSSLLPSQVDYRLSQFPLEGPELAKRGSGCNHGRQRQGQLSVTG